MKSIALLIGACAICTAAYSKDLKYNPGHYVALEGGANLQDFPFLDEAAIRGFNIRYTWAALEPQENRYDFSAIRRDLGIAATDGKQLVAFLTDKTFGPKNANPIPEYIRQYSMKNLPGGISPKKWDQHLVDREIALTRALAKEFDKHSNFEGIAWQESAPSVSKEELNANAYTPEIFRDALVQLLTRSSQAFSSSRVFWYQNFLPGKNEYLTRLRLRPTRCISVGGEDAA